MSRAPRKNLGRGQYGIYDAGRPKEGQSDEQEDAHLVSRTHMFRPIKYRKQSTELWRRRTQSEKVRPELRWHARTRGPMYSLVNSNQFADATVVSSYPHQSIVVHAHVYPCWSYRSTCGLPHPPCPTKGLSFALLTRTPEVYSQLTGHLGDHLRLYSSVLFCSDGSLAVLSCSV